MSDDELLRAYVLEGSEAAFAALVNRYLALVHSVASRHLPDRALSEEVTQAVFVLLARKARSLTGHPSIAGWLHRAAWQLAARTARTEARRRRRESEAASTLPPAMSMPDLPEPAMVLPALDAALQELQAADRDALVLRYFLRKPLRDVGAALGTSEAAAKMRIRRALDHLKVLLARRGITCSPAALAAAMTDQGVTPVAASLAARVIPAATSAGAAAASFPLLIHGILSIMNGTKLAILLTAVLVAALSTALLLRPPSQGTPQRGPDPSVVTPASSQPLSIGTATATLLGASKATAPQDLKAARQRLMNALSAPMKKDGGIGLDPVILEAMSEFGGRQDELFAALKDAFLSPSAPDDQYRLLQTRALQAMAKLDRSVPGLGPFLWETAGKGAWGEPVMAFQVLKQLGLESSDLPALTTLLENLVNSKASPALRTLAPAAMGDVFRREPEASFAHLAEVMRVFDESDDPVTRFSAACILLSTPRSQDSKVIDAVRTGLRGGLNVSPTDHRGVDLSVAIERASAAGEAAKPLIPDLLEVARTALESRKKDSAWLAIGQIQPELRAEIPELDQAMTRDEVIRQTRQNVSQGFATPDDLVRALRDPATAVQAAKTLGETGISSPNVIPTMMAAMEGMDEDSRDQVVAAIQKLDPQTSIERVPADVVFEGVIYASSAADSRAAVSDDPRLERVLSDLRMFHTWRTPEEIFTVTRNLAALDIGTAQAFVNGLAEKDPALAERARQQIAAQPRP